MTKQEREVFMAGALAFMAYITSQPGTIKVGAKHEVYPLMDAYEEWDGSEHQEQTLAASGITMGADR